MLEPVIRNFRPHEGGTCYFIDHPVYGVNLGLIERPSRSRLKGLIIPADSDRKWVAYRTRRDGTWAVKPTCYGKTVREAGKKLLAQYRSNWYDRQDVRVLDALYATNSPMTASEVADNSGVWNPSTGFTICTIAGARGALGRLEKRKLVEREQGGYGSNDKKFYWVLTRKGADVRNLAAVEDALEDAMA